jgi:hypothetical protein
VNPPARMTKIFSLAMFLALTASAAADDWSQFIDPNPSAPMKVTSRPLELPKQPAAAAAPASHASKATKPAAKPKAKARKAKRH